MKKKFSYISEQRKNGKKIIFMTEISRESITNLQRQKREREPQIEKDYRYINQ